MNYIDEILVQVSSDSLQRENIICYEVRVCTCSVVAHNMGPGISAAKTGGTFPQNLFKFGSAVSWHREVVTSNLFVVPTYECSTWIGGWVCI